MNDKIDLFHYMLGGAMLILVCGVMLAQVIWQAYRTYAAPGLLKINAFLLLLVTLVAFLPPYDYASLDRTMVCALLMIPLAVTAAVGDPPRFKILPLAHVGFAALLFYATFLSAS